MISLRQDGFSQYNIADIIGVSNRSLISFFINLIKLETLNIYLEADGLEKQMKVEIGKFYAVLKRTDNKL